MPLDLNDGVNERGMSPGFVYSLLVPRGDHVSCRFVRNGKALRRKLPKDCGLARSGWTGEYESINSHCFTISPNVIAENGSAPEKGIPAVSHKR
jgi:hypothetical protein